MICQLYNLYNLTDCFTQRKQVVQSFNILKLETTHAILNQRSLKCQFCERKANLIKLYNGHKWKVRHAVCPRRRVVTAAAHTVHCQVDIKTHNYSHLYALGSWLFVTRLVLLRRPYITTPFSLWSLSTTTLYIYNGISM